ncbi:MAG: GNAT family N-acetyltransferase [Zetaproteobacteria bacterium]|nr:GNAT family N-acetyltransferase [Zetaproteobacteria bacterium]
MDVLHVLSTQVNHSRDLLNFVDLVPAQPSDDVALAQFLVQTFEQVANSCLPGGYCMPRARKIELSATGLRRAQGFVKILKCGHEILGTYSLLPVPHYTEAWKEELLYLTCFALDPRLHRTQMSDVLWQDIYAQVLGQECTCLGLHVDAHIHRLIAYYEKKGFERHQEGDCESSGVAYLAYAKYLDMNNVHV